MKTKHTMKNEKSGKEPAFPVHDLDFNEDGAVTDETHGMSKRFWAATQIMSGFAADHDMGGDANDLVKLAYKYADELLKQE